jgi:hypothetical protein
MSANREFMLGHLEFKEGFEAIVLRAVDRESAERADSEIGALCAAYQEKHPDLKIHNLSTGMIASYERDRKYDGKGNFELLDTLKLTKSFWVVIITPSLTNPVSLVSRRYLAGASDANLQIVSEKSAGLQ